MPTVTIKVVMSQAQHRELVRRFRSLRDQRAAQPGYGVKGAHPIASASDATAAEWFKAAAILEGARILDEEGPG